eukprot:c16350_g1_i1 orf=633-4841(-)
MENTGGSLRVLSRSSSASGAASQSSSSSSSISLSSSSIPYTPPTSSSFNFPAPPTAHSIPSYPPPACPPLPSMSLLNSSSARTFPSNNLGGKITILTSSAASSPSLLPSASISNAPPSEIPFSTPSGPGLFAVDAPLVDAPANGVVVVGAIGRSEADVSQLLNRLLDAQVFGSEGDLNQDCSSPFDNIQDVNVFQESEKRTGNVVSETQQLNSSSGPHNKVHSVMDGIGQGRTSSAEEEKDANKQDTGASSSCSSKGLKRLTWMRKRLRHYHDEEKGAVYVQFAWESSPTAGMRMDGLDMAMEDSEECTLRGLLYMFSVCHVILLVREGARVDTHVLRTLRILQNAKHLLAPFVKSQVLPGLHLTPPASERNSSSMRSSSSLSSGQSSGRSGTGGRNASTIALMSGSAPSFFPGQCTPVLLFVFLEDFNDATPSSHVISNGDDRADSSAAQLAPVSQQPGGPVISSRQTIHLKGSNAVVMLARATNKSEGGLRKKLQSSLEAQIRYLVKKCKVLAGFGDASASGGIGMGPRGPGSSMGSASGTLGGSSLFVLDTMRAACLLDKGPNLQCDALKAPMSIINDMLRGKEDALNGLTDLPGNSGEDIQAIRDFVWRQAEILRGRGGVLTNSTGGSMGVGMVAAAAAAAAASAAAGGFGGSSGALKPLGNPPELPSMSNWLSACRILVGALVTGEGLLVKDVKKAQPVRVSGSSRRGSLEPSNVATQGKEALGMTLGSLSCATDIDTKFSAEWCKRMFPSALAVYTKALPPCYPTLVHQSHLEKALHMFVRVVRGPAVPEFTNRLKDECEAVWKSGRQLCDAVSLTGRPCIHKVHDVSQGSSDTLFEAKSLEARSNEQFNLPGKAVSGHAKPHSSGLVFLHACACGRSRKLREDPFDFESANTGFFQFSNCEDLLPSLVIPDCEGNKPMGGSAWSLVRLGGAKYYQQSTGLLQSGFTHNKKFLSPWIISYVLGASKQNTSSIFAEALQSNQQATLPSVSRPLIGALSFLDVLEQGNPHSRNEIDAPARVQGKAALDEKRRKVVEKIVPSEKKQAPKTGTNVAWDDKRLFADVVARNTFDFPPLQQRHQKNAKQAGALEKKEAMQQSGQEEPQQGFPALENIYQYKEHVLEDKVQTTPATGAPTMAAMERVQEFGNFGIKNAAVNLGFEHECPRGHRFLLSLEQVEALGSIGPSGENLTASHHKPKGTDNNLKELASRQDLFTSNLSAIGSQEKALKPLADTAWNSNVPDNISCKILKDGSGEGYSLLNTNLPVYMACPYCSKLSDKKKKNAPAFAGNISQLQRIFLVTPPLPLLIATCPSVQFDEACVGQVEHKGGVGGIKFSLGCCVVLPPESFVVLRLPFVYYLELADGLKHPLNCKAYQPESTAWLLKGSTFKIISNSEGGSV